MNGQSNRVKKVLMMTIWRVQQSQALISIVFWSLTLTGIFYPYFNEKFNNFGLPKENVFGGMSVLLLIVLGIILTFGIIYDKVLRLWFEFQVVMMERNPFQAFGKITPREEILFLRPLIKIMERNVPSDDPDLITLRNLLSYQDHDHEHVELVVNLRRRLDPATQESEVDRKEQHHDS